MAEYGGMDMAVAEKWGKAKVVKYRAEGVYKARSMVVFGDYEGKADITDTLTVYSPSTSRRARSSVP